MCGGCVAFSTGVGLHVGVPDHVSFQGTNLPMGFIALVPPVGLSTSVHRHVAHHAAFVRERLVARYTGAGLPAGGCREGPVTAGMMYCQWMLICASVGTLPTGGCQEGPVAAGLMYCQWVLICASVGTLA